MALPASGPISLLDIANEFGGVAPHAINEYYGAAAGIPASGTISLADFYGKSSSLKYLFGPGDLGVYYDTLVSRMYSDSGGTTVATAGQNVLAIEDVSGNGVPLQAFGSGSATRQTHLGRDFAVTSASSFGGFKSETEHIGLLGNSITVIHGRRGTGPSSGIYNTDGFNTVWLGARMGATVYGMYTFPWQGTLVGRYAYYGYFNGTKAGYLSDGINISNAARDTPHLGILTFPPTSGGFLFQSSVGTGGLATSSFWYGTPGDYYNRASSSLYCFPRAGWAANTLNDLYLVINRALSTAEKEAVRQYWVSNFI